MCPWALSQLMCGWISTSLGLLVVHYMGQILFEVYLPKAMEFSRAKHRSPPIVLLFHLLVFCCSGGGCTTRRGCKSWTSGSERIPYGLSTCQCAG